MNTLKKEIEINFTAFTSELKQTYINSYDKLAANNALFLQSYMRITSLQAWKSYVLESIISDETLDFFIEAQNDALLSHCFARIGSWRPALQALRSCIENTLFFLYYKDHHVEYSLWKMNKHKIPINDFQTYIEHHPKFIDINDSTSGIEILRKEQSTLSMAVHASSRKFRMTENDFFPAITIPNVPKLNQWATREKETVKLINQLLLTMFNDYIQGTKLQNLRKTISLSIPTVLHRSIKDELGVHLYS